MSDNINLSDVSDLEVATFRATEYFDEDWYLQEYPDVARSGMDPVRHYLWIGRKLGRDPAPSNGEGRPEVKSSTEQSISYNPTDDSVTQQLILQHLTEEARKAIISAGLFDSEYYRNNYSQSISYPDDLLYDMLNAYFRGDFRDPSALFSVEYYRKINSDTTSLHPLCHYALYGQHEGRPAYSPKKANAFLSNVDQDRLISIDALLAGYDSVHVLYWENGNFFMSDIARYTVTYLENRGYRVTLGTSSPATNEGTLNIITAPHEFCIHGPGKSWSERDLERSAYIATEQWHTSWFMLSRPFLFKSTVGVLDMNPSSACGLAALGVRSAFLPLLPLKGSCFDIPVEPISQQTRLGKFVETLTYSTRLADRSYDVVFVGVLNDRRADILARLAPVLAKYKVFIHAPRFSRPVKKGDPDMLSHSEFVQLARNSKILLNIHQGDSHYLEWQRLFLVGAMEGCVTLSEPNTPNRFMVAGQNLIEADAEHMGDVLDYLLGTEHGAKCLQDIADTNARLRSAIDRGEEFA